MRIETNNIYRASEAEGGYIQIIRWMKDYVIVFFVIILFPLFFLLLLLLLYFSFINNIISIGSIPIKSIVKLRSKQKRERNDEKIVDSKITQKRKKNDEYKCQLCMNNLCATKWTISQILTIISWMPFSFFFFFYFCSLTLHTILK